MSVCVRPLTIAENHEVGRCTCGNHCCPPVVLTVGGSRIHCTKAVCMCVCPSVLLEIALVGPVHLITKLLCSFFVTISVTLYDGFTARRK